MCEQTSVPEIIAGLVKGFTRYVGFIMVRFLWMDFLGCCAKNTVFIIKKIVLKYEILPEESEVALEPLVQFRLSIDSYIIAFSRLFHAKEKRPCH